MVMTLCLFTCYCSFIMVVGRSLAQEMTVATLRRMLLYVQLAEIFYIITTTLLKVSLGLFFLRLLTKRWQVLTFYIILGVSAVYGVIYTFVAIFQCGVPHDLLNNLLHGTDRCLPEAFSLFTGYLYGTINVIADWTFVLIPIYILIESDMTRQSKLSVGIVLALGAIGSISSVMRMVFLKGLLLNGQLTTEAVKATFWATAEPGTGIIAASVAVLRPLFRKVKTEVQDRITQHNTNRSKPKDVENNPNLDSQSLVAMASTKPTSSGGIEDSKRASLYSIVSPTLDRDVTFGEAQVGQVIHIRLTTQEYRPPPPPK
ncbi:hypothetical protein BU24DRAFT_47762 [Aaosphaeria arxii CBS 175.79]|uniref:Rhodopsin domain-containing protein n=1 Tax=Aaosphaeria arxii CBS 175.79 TaxID=1450172 RepID=A0A6A5XCN0_9PLEO|nr:uncharacterized protein BU24DRAFT_47762 [Aaosphaeria arxii CBS 175.79]KAF2010865.1 hypothetical protein BU24DRAFT_47762 [Aaosphaeria arxii CBS 175.79]